MPDNEEMPEFGGHNGNLLLDFLELFAKTGHQTGRLLGELNAKLDHHEGMIKEALTASQRASEQRCSGMADAIRESCGAMSEALKTSETRCRECKRSLVEPGEKAGATAVVKSVLSQPISALAIIAASIAIIFVAGIYLAKQLGAF